MHLALLSMLTDFFVLAALSFSAEVELLRYRLFASARFQEIRIGLLVPSELTVVYHLRNPAILSGHEDSLTWLSPKLIPISD